MSKPKLLLFSQELPNCPCFNTLFNTEFEAQPTESEEAFLESIQRTDIAAAVVCFCSSSEHDAENLLRLDALTGPVPLLTCSKALNLDFVKFAARRGVNLFLRCGMEKRKIHDLIFEAIRRGGLEEFLQSCCPGGLATSPYVRKIVDGIVHSFPHRLHANDMAQNLGIGRRRFQDVCKQAFGISFLQLIRRIWVHQALRMMQHTSLDNTDIALQLNYREESSLARDFRKELGYNPNEARKRLNKDTPEELLLK